MTHITSVGYLIKSQEHSATVYIGNLEVKIKTTAV